MFIAQNIQANHCSPFRWKNPAGTRFAGSINLPNGSEIFFADSRTGLGRPCGYDSLANARRAAYQLTKSSMRSAAAIYQQGNRWFVRSISELGNAARPSNLIHFENNALISAGYLQDPRLAMLVDGSTKIFFKRF